MLTDSTTDEPTSIFDFIFIKNPHRIPDDAPIFSSPEKSLTFGQLSVLIRTCAFNLKEKYGIQKGDVVAIRADPHIDYAVLVHSIVCAGGAVALVSNAPLDTPDTTADSLETVMPKLFITDYEGSHVALAAAEKVGIPISRMLAIGRASIDKMLNVEDELFVGDTLADSCTYTQDEFENQAIFIPYTSGSTGKKKAVIFTPKMVLYSLSHAVQMQMQNKSVLTYQQFHLSSVAFVELFLLVSCGNHAHIEYLQTNDELCQAIDKYKSVRLACPPYILTRLVREQSTKKYDLSSLTLVQTVGSVQHPKITQEANTLLGPIVINVYGATEAPGGMKSTPALSLMGAIGQITPNHYFRLVDHNGKEVKQGEPGELLLKGPTITIGYYNNPEATAKAFTKDGYYRTGDVVRCDSDGIFWFLSRSKNLIKYRHTHIYPSDIEDVVQRHPKVSDCGVIGVFSQTVFDELPRAYVTLVDEDGDKEIIARDILEFANKQLPEGKQIRAGVIVKKSFERTATGKILYSVLKEEAERETI